MKLFDRIPLFWEKLRAPDSKMETASGEAAVTVQVDKPIGSASEDLFDRAPFAARIAAVIARRGDPSSIVVGLYGPWGDGKTSALSMIKEALGGRDDVVTLDYNPWFYGADTEAITRGFFKSIENALANSGWFSKRKIAEIMADYGGLLPKVGESVQNFGKALATEELTRSRDKLGALLRKHGKRIVIFIDDIDRLDRTDMQTLFKLVRLSGGFDHATYVLAFDDSVVAEALGGAYGAGDQSAGRRFLEKIVQVPLQLPAANAEKLRELTFQACDRAIVANGIELSQDEGSDLGNALVAGILPALKTPRQIKLFDNAISFAIPLLKGEVRLIDQIRIEALRIFYPSVYDAVRKNPDDVLRAKKQDDRGHQIITTVEQAVAALDVGLPAQSALREFLQELFPNFDGGGHGSDWEEAWAAQKRACSRAYFPRYFAYTVPAGDFSDLTVDALVAAASDGDRDAVAAIISEALDRQAAEKLVAKLRAREDSLDPGGASVLASEIAARSADLPGSDDIMFGDLACRQAAILVVKLMSRIGNEQQAHSLAESAERSPSLYFLALLVSVGARRNKGGGEDSILSPELLQSVADILLRKLQQGAVESDLMAVTENRLGHILYAIKRNGSEPTQGKLRSFVAGFVAADAVNAIRLLKGLAGRTQGSNGAVSVSDLSPDAYRSLAGLVPPDEIYQQLLAHFGDDLASASWRDDLDDDNLGVDRRIAEQFAYFFNNPPRNADPEATAAAAKELASDDADAGG